MSKPLDPRTERILQRVLDIAERLFSLMLFAIFAKRISQSFAMEPYNLLAVVSEGLVVFFILIRRGALLLTVRPWDWAIALLGTALPMLVRAGGLPLVPAQVSGSLMFIGVIFSIAAKLSLRRSFGLAAANRGLVNRGAYRYIRHPMYAGYMLVYAGFFLSNPNLWNAIVYALTIGVLIARIRAEDAILSHDPGYATFMAQVRYRLVPGVF